MQHQESVSKLQKRLDDQLSEFEQVAKKTISERGENLSNLKQKTDQEIEDFRNKLSMDLETEKISLKKRMDKELEDYLSELSEKVQEQKILAKQKHTQVN